MAINPFYQAYLKRKWGKTVHFKGGTKIDKNCFFEGYNSLSFNSVLRNCEIGIGTYIGEEVTFSSIKIGRFCSIGSRVSNIRGRHPINNFVSTHPSFYSTAKQAGFTFTDKNKFKEISYANEKEGHLAVIGHDVWIGDNVLILDGITIGSGSVIGAGSIITKNIEPYSINAGIPCKPIKYRFDEKDIEFLLNFEWWNKDFSWIKKNYNRFENIIEFTKELQNLKEDR